MEDRPLGPTTFVAWLLAAPLLLSWGLGTVHPVLDVAAVPAAVGLAVPAWLGWPGCVVALAFALAGDRTKRLNDAFGFIGGLSLLASAVAATRPLAWVALVAAAVARRRTPTAPALNEQSLRWLAPLAWLLASRARPWGPGLLPSEVEAALGRLADAALPVHGGEIAPAVAAAGVAVVLGRRRDPDLRGALIGGAVALLLVATVGGGRWWGSAAAIGMVAGAWPPRWTLRPAHLVPSAVLLLSLVSVRAGTTERWRCEAQEPDRQVHRWRGSLDVASIGVVPGNLPFLVVLRDHGRRLERLSTTGAVVDSAAIDLQDARLLSAVGGAGIALVAATGDGLQVERWIASPLERASAHLVGDDCRPVGGDILRDGSVRVLCEGAGVLLVEADGTSRKAPAPNRRPLVLGDRFLLSGGPLGRLAFGWDDVAGVGPWATGVAPGPARLFVARGPAGQVEVRGAGPTLPGAVVDEVPERLVRRAARKRLDRIRVRGWPSQVGYSDRQGALWVTSQVDGTVTLADPGVVWHQRRATVGPPPTQVVVDGGSGTLYGLNRCGVFEVDIRSTFPWPSSGDVEAAERPVEAPTGG